MKSLWYKPLLYKRKSMTAMLGERYQNHSRTQLHRRSKVSVQNSQAGQHDESRHNFKVVYIHQQVHYASLLSVL